VSLQEEIGTETHPEGRPCNDTVRRYHLQAEKG
jgi:hypothetical protein